MSIKFASCLAAFGLGALLVGCSKPTTEQRMQKHMEFYYPSTGDYTYEVVFDWGVYAIKTEAAMAQTVHRDSESYRSYIVMRPRPKAGSVEQGLAIYLINPKGEVWKTTDVGIAASRQREEVEVTKDEGGTATMTRTIQSISEPVIDHFLDNAKRWQRYGTLEPGNGQKSTLVLAK